jgi:protoheme IX farnesyltransferase
VVDGLQHLCLRRRRRLLGLNFLRHAWLTWTDAQDATGVSLTRDAPAKACFKYSITYLFALLGALALDRLLLA